MNNNIIILFPNPWRYAEMLGEILIFEERRQNWRTHTQNNVWRWTQPFICSQWYFLLMYISIEESSGGYWQI